MSVENQIKTYIDSQSGSKHSDLQSLHILILDLMPKAKLWFLDGKNATGKTIANPNIGYGLQMINYVDGSSKEFYQIGISTNTKGISVYIIGINDKEYLAKTFFSNNWQGKYNGVLYQIQNNKRYKYQCSKICNTVWN